MNGERQLIESIAKTVPSVAGWPSRAELLERARVRIGIGDDAAVLAPGGRSEWILTCDAFLEGVHFLGNVHPAESVGYKSLARATSDLAAMGAAPCAFLLTLALPQNRMGKWLDQFLAGMRRAARELGVRLIGGDTTKSSTVFISITVIGSAAPGQALTRAGARPGDIVYVSGPLGKAQLGLHLLCKGYKGNRAGERALRPFLRKHLYPRARVELGAWLARKRIASAMIDISDGLSTDLTRLCEASRVGARIDLESVPRVEIPPAARKLRDSRPDALQLALHGGEDYELLFTVPRRKAARLRGAPKHSGIAAIGAITRERKILLTDAMGRAGRFTPGGWDPFRKKGAE
jgi:thiamine-monophosphate kinase